MDITLGQHIEEDAKRNQEITDDFGKIRATLHGINKTLQELKYPTIAVKNGEEHTLFLHEAMAEMWSDTKNNTKLLQDLSNVTMLDKYGQPYKQKLELVLQNLDAKTRNGLTNFSTFAKKLTDIFTLVILFSVIITAIYTFIKSIH